MLDATSAHRSLCSGFEFRLIGEERRRSVFNKATQLRTGKTPVQRLQNRSCTHAGEMQNKCVDAVPRQNRDTLTGCRTEQTFEIAGALCDLTVEFVIGQTHATCEIDACQTVAIGDRMNSDEVGVVDDASGCGFHTTGRRGHRYLFGSKRCILPRLTGRLATPLNWYVLHTILSMTADRGEKW